MTLRHTRKTHRRRWSMSGAPRAIFFTKDCETFHNSVRADDFATHPTNLSRRCSNVRAPGSSHAGRLDARVQAELAPGR